MTRPGYVSTRSVKKEPATFEEALFSGYAPDGGIYLPTRIPSISKDTLKHWSTLPFTSLVFEVLKLFISEDEIPHQDLHKLISKGFSRFERQEVITVRHLKGGLKIAELFHGPTMAFKDIALGIVGQLMGYFLERRKKHVTILVGTSGDTGSAAIESVRGNPWIDIVVLLPRGRCSKLQELQMTTVDERNVHVYRVDGTSDDIDEPIKRCFADTSSVRRHNLCSINSINWTRVMIQTAHYFYSYFQVVPGCDTTTEIVVPTGALGNTASGVVAMKMGLPIRIVCAVNTNDIVARSITNGDMSMASEMVSTLAPAMDILMPYNMERLLYLFSDGDSEMVRKVQGEFEKAGKTKIPEKVLGDIQRVISSVKVDDAGIKATLRRCWEENRYLLCPHTAIAAHYHYNNPASSPRICLATASPGKFTEAILAAGLEPMVPSKLKKLYDAPTFSSDMEKTDDWDAMLKQKIESVTEAREHP